MCHRRGEGREEGEAETQQTAEEEEEEESSEDSKGANAANCPAEDERERGAGEHALHRTRCKVEHYS